MYVSSKHIIPDDILDVHFTVLGIAFSPDVLHWASEDLVIFDDFSVDAFSASGEPQFLVVVFNRAFVVSLVFPSIFNDVPTKLSQTFFSMCITSTILRFRAHSSPLEEFYALPFRRVAYFYVTHSSLEDSVYVT
ncbi:hypothetical protein E5676_scaffold302G00310 [Cucumis melo var. makuwa]|uniref:Uncharacterized protein n=1 Tax=Cucumis melo var. makuwa TaxID=1194695 RepID=A0A5D3CK43_CUCMM|nr:hypothetical protein E6C27_scaffold110G00650 [Cucumis melo var. makuwa]TYK12273.1 hypothetical protein E5676_scaffold302G00310 [Cucumis melo var. makuwa]